MARTRLTVYDGVTPYVYNAVMDSTLTLTRNTLAQLDFEVLNMSAADYLIIADNKLVTYEEYDPDTLSYYEIFRGYVRNVEKLSYRRARIRASSAGIKLYDKNWETREEARYINQATDDVVDATASGTITVGTNDITDIITIEFGLQNKLMSIAQIAGVHGAEWWTDTGPFLEDRINVSSSRYSITSAATFEVGKSARIASDNKDSDRIYNCITVLGQGDGINQVKSASYGFCTQIKELTAKLTVSGSEFFVDDSTGMSSTNGIVYINNEKIKYAFRTGLRCYTLTVWDEDTSSWVARTRLNGSYEHSTGIKVWYAGTTAAEYTKTNPAPGSSVETYGIREFTHYDRSILRLIGGEGTLDDDIDPFETASKVAYILYNRYKQPLRTITFLKSNYRLEHLDVGKVITIVDAQQALNADFKIYKIEYIKKNGVPSIKITCNSLLYDFFETLDDLQKDMDTTGIYGQGATNITETPASENIDTDHPMHLRFYLSPEVVAVNRIKLNFKMENYRADSKSVTVAPRSKMSFGYWNCQSLPATHFGVSSSQRKLDMIYNVDDTYYDSIAYDWEDISDGGYSAWIVHNSGSGLHYTNKGGVVTKLTYYGSGDWYVDETDPDEYDINDGYGEYFPCTSDSEGISYTNDIIWDINGTNAYLIKLRSFTDDVYSIAGKFTWSDPIYVAAVTDPVSDATHPFDRIEVTYAITNGTSATRSVTINLQFSSNGGVSWSTLNTQIASIGAGVTTRRWYTDTNSSHEDGIYRVVVSGLIVNSETSTDNSAIDLLVHTLASGTADLTYGIYENSSEFTPPGIVDITVGIDGAASPTIVGTYSSDQSDLDITDSIVYESSNWYDVIITPRASTYNGRMRIEAILFKQVYIESR